MAREVIKQEIQGRSFRVFKTLNDGRYEFERVLASGGQGVTFIARDTRLAGNRVLIKAPLHGNSLAKGPYTFKEEKRGRHNAMLYEVGVMGMDLTARTQNVPRLICYFYDQNASLMGSYPFGSERWTIDAESEHARDMFLVYEFLSAGRGARALTLEDVIEQQGGPLEEGFVLEMARQIAGVLAELHDRQEPENAPAYYYVYQDMKPANILVTGDRYFFLIDFGGLVEAQVRGSERTDIVYPSGAVTCGYAPPEAYDPEGQKHLNQRADIFSLGATMFHALSGVHPILLLDDPTNLQSAPNFSLPRIRERAPQYQPSRLVHQIVERATSRYRVPDREGSWYPERCYGSIQQMLTDILSALGED